MKKIASFTVDHNRIIPGIYVSRIDGDITTYDLRTRKPNNGDYMDNETMHSIEHLFATMVRNSKIKDDVIYFGPMGCQTGFYLLVRNAKDKEVIDVTLEILRKIVGFEGEIYGNSPTECGNYKTLNLQKAKTEAKKYLDTLLSYEKISTVYPK